MTTASPIVLSSQRRVHVPVQARKKVPGADKPALPRDLALTRADAAFRGVAWTRPATASVAPPPPPPGPPSPVALARVVFAQIAWSGERFGAPTSVQSARSVEAILKSFRWE